MIGLEDFRILMARAAVSSLHGTGIVVQSGLLHAKCDKTVKPPSVRTYKYNSKVVGHLPVYKGGHCSLSSTAAGHQS
jgi:hypothetical protein